MNKKKIFSILLLVVMVISGVGGTFALRRVVGSSVQNIDLSAVKGEIVEQYNPPEKVYPGGEFEKVVNVQNTGSADSVVRVKIEKFWREETALARAGSLSTDNILITFNTKYWTHDDKDGYFYYKDVLKAGEKTLEPLFESVRIDMATGPEYAGLTADIDVIMECVQAEAHGVSIWNKQFSDLGIVYNGSEQKTEMASVVLQGNMETFAFDPNSTDLFVNFKSLLPGEARSQTVQVRNETAYKTEIFLNAEYILQNEENRAIIEKLVGNHATITITATDGTILYSGPISGNPNGGSPSMADRISLGWFLPSQSTDFVVQLQVDSEIGNEFSGLNGKIQWRWEAEIDDSVPNPNPNPNPKTPGGIPFTGDDMMLIVFGGLFVASLGILIVLGMTGKKRKAQQ